MIEDMKRTKNILNQLLERRKCRTDPAQLADLEGEVQSFANTWEEGFRRLQDAANAIGSIAEYDDDGFPDEGDDRLRKALDRLGMFV